MSSAVLELQNEVTKSDCDIVSVLRRAHLIATKLDLKDFNQWIINELNGYNSQNDVPEYRSVPGLLKAFNPYSGWIPVLLNNPEIENLICRPKMANSISEISALCKGTDSSIVMSLPVEVQNSLNEMCDNPIPMRMAIHISKTAAADIIEKVKNTLIEWTLELESKGILGEGMSFNEQEKESAKSIPQQINNYYSSNVINGTTGKIQANAGKVITANFDYEKAKNDVDEIEDSIQKSEELSIEDKEAAFELLADVKNKIESKKKDAIIKAALVGLKDFLINTGAGLTVAVIQAKMQNLF